MKRPKHLGAWSSVTGDARVDVGAGQVKGVVVTDGASLRFVCGAVEWVLASGRGQFEFDFYSPEAGHLALVADHADAKSSVLLSAWGPVPQPEGWTEGESFVQLEPKSADDVPQAVRDMMARMEANQRRREATLLAEIQRMRGGA